MRKLIIIAIFLSSLGYAQEQISIQITQDAKLGIVGDSKHDYSAGTMDMTFAVMMQGNQKKWGYIIVYPEFEYADLKIEAYRRWTANVGYTFNQLVIPNLEVGASGSFGFIDRGLTDFCWGLNAFTKYKLCDAFKIVANMQLTQRPDIGIMYGVNNEYRYSGFIGLEINIFETFNRGKVPYGASASLNKD